MNADAIKALLNRSSQTPFDIYERREGDYQVILPIRHEDGDMLDIYLQKSPKGENYIRICDFGLTLMRLSYSYEINSARKKKVLENIIYNDNIINDAGNLYIDAKVEKLFENILQYSGCIKKICSMSYWDTKSQRITPAKLFYNDINDFIFSELEQFSPKANIKLHSSSLFDFSFEYDLHNADWMLSYLKSYFLIFAVNDNNRANRVAVDLLELNKASAPVKTLVVNKDESKLGRVERKCIERNSTIKYEIPERFKRNASRDISELSLAA